MKRGKEERKFCMCVQRHKQIISAAILSFAILLIFVIALFPSLVDRRTSSAVSAEQLDEGVQIALFDPRYQRDQHASAIDYQETTLKSTAKQGLLLQGPELTLPAIRIELRDLVVRAEWTHLYSYRTQKLSTPAAKIVGQAPAKTARCQVFIGDHMISFFFAFW